MRDTIQCNRRRGTVTVEFSLVFPVILSFFISSLMLLQAYTLKDTAQHAAYEGARAAVVIDAEFADCESAVNNFLALNRVQGAAVTMTPSVITSSTDEVTVHVDIPFSSNTWIAGGVIPPDWSAQAEVTLARDASN